MKKGMKHLGKGMKNKSPMDGDGKRGGAVHTGHSMDSAGGGKKKSKGCGRTA